MILKYLSYFLSLITYLIVLFLDHMLDLKVSLSTIAIFMHFILPFQNGQNLLEINTLKEQSYILKESFVFVDSNASTCNPYVQDSNNPEND